MRPILSSHAKQGRVAVNCPLRSSVEASAGGHESVSSSPSRRPVLSCTRHSRGDSRGTACAALTRRLTQRSRGPRGAHAATREALGPKKRPASKSRESQHCAAILSEATSKPTAAPSSAAPIHRRPHAAARLASKGPERQNCAAGISLATAKPTRSSAGLIRRRTHAATRLASKSREK